MINKTGFWDERRGVIRTRKGGWNIGYGVMDHGYSLLDELLGHISFFQLMILHVTGKIPERRLADWLEASYMCLSWPDSRIWCNQIGSLAGSAGISPSAGVCAGSLAADSRLYGVGTLVKATRFINKALSYVNSGSSTESFIETQCWQNGKLIIPGYARPIARGDERVIAIQVVERNLGYCEGPHLSLAYQISDYLCKKYNEGINFAGYVVAFLSDQNFNENEIERIFSLWVNGGLYACYSEAADQPGNAFMPLRCDDILYHGAEERSVPEEKL